MDNATNLRTNGMLFSQIQQLQGIAWRGRRDSNLFPPSNISYLTTKPMRTFAYKWIICVQIVYK
ncbi:uncharacterized protein METZ01_LOCUS305750 [marine metagenome]|uniref:Uncharacterized protein n=1 Tax=marine metagenome TaxID=408172 RepID=A0A382MVU5_9ZZZZ